MAKKGKLVLIVIALVLVFLVSRREGFFTEWPGAGVRAQPPLYAVAKEKFVSKKCPDGTRSDGPCLMEFPGF